MYSPVLEEEGIMFISPGVEYLYNLEFCMGNLSLLFIYSLIQSFISQYGLMNIYFIFWVIIYNPILIHFVFQIVPAFDTS